MLVERTRQNLDKINTSLSNLVDCTTNSRDKRPHAHTRTNNRHPLGPVPPWVKPLAPHPPTLDVLLPLRPPAKAAPHQSLDLFPLR